MSAPDSARLRASPQLILRTRWISLCRPYEAHMRKINLLCIPQGFRPGLLASVAPTGLNSARGAQVGQAFSRPPKPRRRRMPVLFCSAPRLKMDRPACPPAGTNVCPTGISRVLLAAAKSGYSQPFSMSEPADANSTAPPAMRAADGGGPTEFAPVLWPRLAELWILMTIVIFVFLRILGSHTAQRILSLVRHVFGR